MNLRKSAKSADHFPLVSAEGSVELLCTPDWPNFFSGGIRFFPITDRGPVRLE
jgi:hypothetical protein